MDVVAGPLRFERRGKRWVAARGAATWTVPDADGHPSAAALARATALAAVDVEAAIARFVRALPPEHPVPLRHNSWGHFAAESCGFAGDLYGLAVIVDDDGAHASFYTGFPDGYATYEVALSPDGTPAEVSAYAS